VFKLAHPKNIISKRGTVDFVSKPIILHIITQTRKCFKAMSISSVSFIAMIMSCKSIFLLILFQFFNFTLTFTY